MKIGLSVLVAAFASAALSSAAGAQQVVERVKPGSVPAPPPIMIPKTMKMPEAAPPPPAQWPKLRSVARIERGLLSYTPDVHSFLGQAGRATISVIVGTNGRARDCLVERSSGYAEIDKRACQVMERFARFYPALDEAGNPVDAAFRQTLGWSPSESGRYNSDYLGFEYPAAALETRAQGSVRVSVSVSPSGSVAGCTLVESSGSQALDKATCENVRKLRGSPRGPEAETGELLVKLDRIVKWRLPEDDEGDGAGM